MRHQPGSAIMLALLPAVLGQQTAGHAEPAVKCCSCAATRHDSQAARAHSSLGRLDVTNVYRRESNILNAPATVVALFGSATRQVPVFVRTVRIDPLLLASGLDSAEVRQELLKLLRDYQRLQEHPDEATPAIDVSLSLYRSISDEVGGAIIGVEVGRNLMESGQTQRLAWQRTESIRGPATLQSLIERSRPILMNLAIEFARH